MNTTKPANDTLWMLTLAPAIWAAHLMLCYLTAAIWCAKFAGPDGSLGGVRSAIGWYTAVALTGIAIIGWEGFRRHSYGTETTTHDRVSRPRRSMSTEGGDAPGWQGARSEHIGEYVSDEQRSQPGRSAGRMPTNVGDATRDSPEDRHRFLGFATLLLSGLSAVATIYVALAGVFFETCR